MPDSYEWTFSVGFNPDRPRSRGMLDAMRAAGMPEAAIKPDRTIDLTVALAAGWRLVNGVLYGPPAA